MKKMPPIEKVYEAFSAMADGRVTMGQDASRDAGSAQVVSSDGAKIYAIAWCGRTFSSTDNASYWQGYPGYPVIAVLLALGVLAAPQGVMDEFTGVNWHDVNKRFKRDYAAAAQEVFEERGITGPAADEARSAAQTVYEQLACLDLTIVRKLKPAE